MQVDFESVIERKFHAWFNYMEGVMHTGQRNQVRIRVSNAAYDAGLRLKDFAEVLYVMIMDEFDAVVDKCQITLITDAAEAEKFRDEVAMPRYNQRDDRLASMTDEAVDRYFTCIMCQSFAPRPLLRGHPRASGSVRRRVLAGCQGYLRAEPQRSLPAHLQGRLRGRAHRPLPVRQQGDLPTRPTALLRTSPCTPFWRTR